MLSVFNLPLSKRNPQLTLGLSVQMSSDPGISAFPEGDNIFSWAGTIQGSVGTVYEGLTYKLNLRFPSDYPFKPPEVKFVTFCFHPNVDQAGNICLDILKVRSLVPDSWPHTTSCGCILHSQFLS